MSLSNQKELEDNREREAEIKQLREAMKTMTPEERVLAEKFIPFYEEVIEALSKEDLNKEQTETEP